MFYFLFLSPVSVYLLVLGPPSVWYGLIML